MKIQISGKHKAWSGHHLCSSALNLYFLLWMFTRSHLFWGTAPVGFVGVCWNLGYWQMSLKLSCEESCSIGRSDARQQVSLRIWGLSSQFLLIHIKTPVKPWIFHIVEILGWPEVYNEFYYVIIIVRLSCNPKQMCYCKLFILYRSILLFFCNFIHCALFY